MDWKELFIVYFVILLNLCNTACFAETIDITDPCRYPVAVGMEREYIPDDHIWATSETNIARGPSYARLNGWRGGGAWTAGTPNIMQRLGIDLGYRHVITAVATQGRRGSLEFVTEFYLEFSSDNKTWSVYTNEFGTPLLFEGNDNDNGVKRTNLEYPIVARYVQFNPQRWHHFISMRVEVYGCRFDAEAATFDGQSRITYDISGENQYVQTWNDHIKMRFRTNEADGLLLFADGNQGDYLIMSLVRGELYLHLDLGSTATVSGDTTLKAGSLLDDNQWHEVEITREGRRISLNVDRLTIQNITNGEFYQLDLDRYVHLGGIDTFMQPGKTMYVRSNFTGCLENVWFNYMNIIQDTRKERERFNIHGNVMIGTCMIDQVIPFTFPTMDSHLEIVSIPSDRLRVNFHFRTYNRGGVLFSNKLNGGGRVMMQLDDYGYLVYSVQTQDDPEVLSTITNPDRLTETDSFTDGLWHSVYVDIQAGTEADSLGNSMIGVINITVDGITDLSNRQLQFTTTELYYVGGGDLESGEIGFLGCMRQLDIGGERKQEIPPEAYKGVQNGTCTIQDRCDPNPCEHGGICSQDYLSFYCDCSHTQYEGAVCHKSQYFTSCEESRMLNPMISEKDITIDLDDSGPLEPFPVTCMFEDHRAQTEVHHQNEALTRVDGYDAPGSYVRPIIYPVKEREQFDLLVARSASCRQNIRYTCKGSRLLSSSGSNNPNIPSFGWWIGRTNLNMRYWGGSSPGSGKCACALKNECRGNNQMCNCDEGLLENNVFDDGYITQKEHLPVMELRFGDTGTLNDQKWGEHTLGPLICEGDNLFNNTVTFRKEDATIELPTFDAATSGDIRFQFKTTQENGILLQNTGRFHFIEVKLVFRNSIHFRFDVGNGIQTLEMTTSYPMNDDTWHKVYIERNRKQAILLVDQQSRVVIDEPIGQGYRSLDLTSNLVIGAAVDYKDGFVGCIRALMVNGRAQDLRGMVERGEVTYGVSAGCKPKCENNPCMNEGICLEMYSHYTCDCAYTPYRGWVCGREVGMNMKPNYMALYHMDSSSGTISTDEETIIIGFSTQIKRGILMQITNENGGEYISVEVNNNGGVKVVLDVGWQIGRDEVNADIPAVDLANGQQHIVEVHRWNKGKGITVAVDEYPPLIHEWTTLDDSADTKLDNPSKIYFGRNTTSTQGFEGCLFRAQFDNQFPIKRIFQDPFPSNIDLIPPGVIREDMCGFEEVTHEPQPAEFRPTMTPDPNITSKYYIDDGGLSSGEKKLLIGIIREDMCGKEEVTLRPEPEEFRFFPTQFPVRNGTLFADEDFEYTSLTIGILCAILFVIIAVAFILARYYSRHKGAYKTYEAKDAQYFEDADQALASDITGQPEIAKKKEWFI